MRSVPRCEPMMHIVCPYDVHRVSRYDPYGDASQVSGVKHLEAATKHHYPGFSIEPASYGLFPILSRN